MPKNKKYVKILMVIGVILVMGGLIKYKETLLRVIKLILNIQ